MDLDDFLLARIAEEEAEIAAGFDFATLDSSGWMGHAATWGRDRAIAECDTKRRIVQIHAAGEHACPSPEALDDGLWSITDQDVMRPCPTLRLLALPYVDHPVWREEWRP